MQSLSYDKLIVPLDLAQTDEAGKTSVCVADMDEEDNK